MEGDGGLTDCLLIVLGLSGLCKKYPVNKIGLPLHVKSHKQNPPKQPTPTVLPMRKAAVSGNQWDAAGSVQSVWAASAKTSPLVSIGSRSADTHLRTEHARHEGRERESESERTTRQNLQHAEQKQRKAFQ